MVFCLKNSLPKMSVTEAEPDQLSPSIGLHVYLEMTTMMIRQDSFADKQDKMAAARIRVFDTCRLPNLSAFQAQVSTSII